MGRQQHYVWQHHLNAWANSKQQISVLTEDSIFKVNTEKIAKESYFYEIKLVTVDEFKFIKRFLLNNASKGTVFMNTQLFNVYEQIFSAIEEMKEGQFDGNKLLNALREIDESVISTMEANFLSHLKKLRQRNREILLDKGCCMEIAFFTSFQYFRTKRMRDGVIDYIVDKNPDNNEVKLFVDIFRRSWSFAKYFYTNNVGFYMRDFNFCYLVNNTEIEMLSSDQPVVNTKATYSDNVVEEMEFYYPLSPKLALLISPSDKIGHATEIELTALEVSEYNKKIIQGSFKMVFCNNIELLKNIGEY